MPTTEETFVASVEAVLDSLVTITKAAIPEALVVSNFLFDPDHDAWAGLLRSDDDVDDHGDRRIHAICIYPEGLDEEDAEDTPTGCFNPLINFGFVFYLGHYIGTNASNSARQIMREVALVKCRLAEKRDLDMRSVDDETVRSCVAGHSGLRAPRFQLKQLGAHPVNIAPGSLEVEMQSVYVRA